MEFEVLGRAASQRLKLRVTNARFVNISSAPDIKEREELVLDRHIAFDGFRITCLLGSLAPQLQMVAVVNIVLCALGRVLQRVVGFYKLIEAVNVAGLGIIRVIALGKMPENASIVSEFAFGLISRSS